MSWNISNINGLLGNKAEDPTFVRNLNLNDIICLQETGEEVNIKGFKSYSDIRLSGKGGGVTTLVRDNVNKHCQRVEQKATDETSMNVVTLKFTDPTSKVNTFIINSYIPPANSSHKKQNHCSASNFDKLHSIASGLRENNSDEMLILGDLNARIGKCNDLEMLDRAEPFSLFPETHRSQCAFDISKHAPISEHRNCRDTGTNSHKKHLLDLVGSQNLVILNGRTLGDSEGQYTCFKWNGNSTVDLFISCPLFLKRVRSLKVARHTLYSDHSPVILRIGSDHNKVDTSKPPINQSPDVPVRAPFHYKVNEPSLKDFQKLLDDDHTKRKIDQLNKELDDPLGDPSENARKLCNEITSLINDIASRTLERSKPPKTGKPKYQYWFDDKCHTARRLLRRSVRTMESCPDKTSIKKRHCANVRDYRSLINRKQDLFFQKLNQKVKSGKSISWRDFKKLKKMKTTRQEVGSHLLKPFQEFYSKLYADDHPSIDQLTKKALLQDATALADSSTPNDLLNSPFTTEELNSAINSLKSGKASSLDHINNEMLKALTTDARKLILRLFNLCLSSGTYLWSESVITPIHKKGSTENPDNYRAIAVCSCIGKLLSTMLLSRLVVHIQSTYPDPPNQAGFTKGSQCNDHIFTLMSIMEKYRRVKGKVYSVFIDLRKAFDLVCRQALLFKLACYGVNGGYFNIIKDMYSSSRGFIKLEGKLSQAFNILKGTEQGHPLSPELFKAYFKELSDLLNNLSVNCPSLSGISVSHLAWADDLVILALDTESLQTQLNTIEQYCKQWGLEINVSKTKFMVMNGTVPPKPNWRPTLNDTPIELVTSYCYLGVLISSNGKLTQAVSSLHRKALGAYFSLRNTVDRRFIDAESLNKLFNTLVSPILMYGCQVWCPTTPIIKTIINSFRKVSNLNQVLPKIAKFSHEQVHLRHLKYLLGVNKRSSNLASWGETGRFPLIFESMKLSIDYFKRVMNLSPSLLVRAAMNEQICLELSWFSNIRDFINCFDDTNLQQHLLNSSPILNATSLSEHCSPSLILSNIQKHFISSWKSAISTSRKLTFYHTIKDTFNWEPYLDHANTFNDRRTTAKIRCSSHKLNIEAGRYANVPLERRKCQFCESNKIADVIEDEDHALHVCPIGDQVRAHLRSKLHNPGARLNLAKTFQRKETPSEASGTKLSSNDIRDIKLKTRAINNIYSLILSFKKALNPLPASVQSSHAI